MLCKLWQNFGIIFANGVLLPNLNQYLPNIGTTYLPIHMSALCKFVTVNRRYRRFCPHQIFILIGSWWRFSGHHRVALPHWRSEFESCWSQQIVLCRLKSFFNGGEAEAILIRGCDSRSRGGSPITTVLQHWSSLVVGFAQNWLTCLNFFHASLREVYNEISSCYVHV